MIASSEIGPDGEVRFTRPPADQRFVEPYSGLYFQISGAGADTFPSRSLWDRRLRVSDRHHDVKPHLYDSNEFSTRATPSRSVSPSATSTPAGFEDPLALPGRASRENLDEQIHDLRQTLCWSFARARRRPAHPRGAADLLWPVAAAPGAARSRRDPLGREDADQRTNSHREIRPLTEEINQLLAHSEAQAEEARRHAGNLAHALKTPLTVITNAATANAPDLADTVCREATVMRRQVDHHLARARAIGRRATAQARATVWESLEAVQRAVDRLYENVTVDIAGDKQAQVRVERQDLDEMLGNLVENAAKYGGGRVFVTVEPHEARWSTSWSRTTGPGSRRRSASRSFTRGARLDTTASPAPASASPSSATSPRFTAARSRWRKAKIWAACLRG